ncbi:MAG: DUF3887 domain-containing protein [Erythrobacter sp.]|uniref:hypothetical protein n=1 Tax=Erythrobacter sp. TaxID=1042 RepID=UPI0025D4DB5F|nr:hypothetical protein [Erythrobacter sp.]MCL9999442.1 DUF3887 domain-containing protein [Erythrobacter sp.]
MNFRMLLALAAALLLAACNPGAQVADAKVQIETLQALYNKGDAQGFYGAGGDTLRKAAPAEHLEGMMALIDARLGKIRSSKQTGFNTAIKNGATTTTIVMRTSFERGEGTETYVFEGSGKDMKLAGWNVNSPLLNLSPEDVKKLTSDEGKAR